MCKMEEFIQASILIIALTISAFFLSSVSYPFILFCGLLMIVFSIRSLSESRNKLLLFIQFLLSIVFSILSGMIGYLIFYEYRLTENKTFRIVFPPLFYFAVQLVIHRLEFWQILFQILILFIFSTLLSLAEQTAVSYLAARSQIPQAVSAAAINEMYEKKLNRELVIKNYLADKNARLEERENISRNIHNSAGHSLTAAIMTLEAADMLFLHAPDTARKKMNIANERIRTALNTIRHAVRVLDSEDKFISADDFISELTAVTDNFVMDTGIVIHTDFSEISGNLSIPHEHTEFLTGAVQELLTNGVRHGGADQYIIYLSADVGHIKISISDNGKSDFSSKNQSEKIKNGFGLKKLISYVEKCGGTIMFANENGFKTVVTLPLYKEDYQNE